MSDNNSDDGHVTSRPGKVGASPEQYGQWKPAHSLGDDGLTPHQLSETLKGFQGYIEEQVHSFLGYQANQHAEYSTQLSWMLDHHVNNLGDPFVPGNFTVNSKALECEVLDYYARLWHAKSPHHADDDESYWGYVLSMGSTEGNLYGLWNARDYLGGKALIRDPDDSTRLLWASAIKASRLDGDALIGQDDAQQDTVAFYSADTHYSLTKVVRVLGIPTFAEIGNARYPGQCPLEGFAGVWPAEVPSVDGDRGDGSIDVDKLCTLVEFFASRGHPALISLNVGTTFKGAYDPVAKIEPRIVTIMKDHHMYDRVLTLPGGETRNRHGFWIHVDGALGAAYLPYLQMAKKAKIKGAAALADIPKFDFGIEHVFSIAMSGHKWIGAPWPCGVYMTKVKYQLKPPSDPEYVNSPDTTFAGSRSGFSSAVLWEHLARYSQREQMERAVAAQDVADYAVRALTKLGAELKRELHVARTPLSLTVRFLKPVGALVRKYSLSTEKYLDDQGVTYAHLFAMPGVTTELIDRLIDDLRDPIAFEDPAQPPTHAAVSARAVSDLADAQEVSAPVPATAVPLIGRGFH
ncbi:MAG: pyridoxal-dependent decarboxylase [Mycobacterium sp.]|uniref:pyridoxal-dependent decarboxylase n=3 Tax=Mycobacterium sp. TaxID=1785 RepID=UPI003BB7E463